ncbi:MAG: FAD:protein FMN transferase [Nitrospirae bacterium]|nr:FAD:protein FMN transferase [Nitrospirota bacterium]
MTILPRLRLRVVSFPMWVLTAGVLLIFSISACSPKLEVYHRSQYQMGTIVDLKVAASSEKAADEAMSAGFAEIRRLEELLSVYKETSEYSKINQMAGIEPVAVSPETFELVQKGLEAGKMTDGGFNIAIGPAVMLWGVTESHHIPSQKELEQIRPLVDLSKVVVDISHRTVFLTEKGMKIDSGGNGKGFAADRVKTVLQNSGIQSGIVALAGDDKVFGKRPDGKPWRVAISHPRKKGEVLAYLELTDKAISTAGDYERFFEKDGVIYHHILDPVTLQPARECQSVTLISDEGIIADSLDTGIFVMGPEKGMALVEKLPYLGGVIVDKNGKILISSNLKDKVKLP